MGKYLIDNNVISHYFSGLFSEMGMGFIAKEIDKTPNISIITEIEALSWIAADKNKEKIVREFVKDSNVLGLTSAIVSRCVMIRRNQKIKIPDAIIAATAVIHNLTLITSDRDFDNILGLKIFNPQAI